MKNISFEHFPRKHIFPYDGMAITASVWEEAHTEHRQADLAHRLHLHGSGIIGGLEVVANDPPDQYVFISPGAAIDSAGNIIVVPEPVAYDFSNTAEGRLFLLLAHGEREIGGAKNAVKYVQDEFVITARPTIPKRPTVELARIVLPQAGTPIRDAEDSKHPTPGTLDLRFRQILTPSLVEKVHVLALVSEADMEDVTAGWDALARTALRENIFEIITDIFPMNEAPKDWAEYDLLYLGIGAFQDKSPAARSIKEFLSKRIPLFVEVYDEAADAAFRAWLESIKHPLRKLATNNSLFYTPFLFGVVPEEFSGSRIEESDSMLYTTALYASAWRGMWESSWLSREKIRTLHEWGINLIHYSLQKRKTL